MTSKSRLFIEFLENSQVCMTGWVHGLYAYAHSINVVKEVVLLLKTVNYFSMKEAIFQNKILLDALNWADPWKRIIIKTSD